MSSPSTEEKLKMVAALSSSRDTYRYGDDDNNMNNDTTTKSIDEDSDGMATAVTPITTNVSSNTNVVADNESKEVAVDVAQAFPVSSSSSTSASASDEEEESELEDGAQKEESEVQDQVDQDDTDEEIPSDEEMLTPTTTNVTDANAASADTTDVMYSFPIQEEDEHENVVVDSDINSHQTSLEGVDIAEDLSSVATTNTTNNEDGSVECLPLPSILSPDSPSNHHHQVEVDLADMEALPSPFKSHDGKMVKKDNGTPVTSNTASDSDSSYTNDDDDSSSNFSTTSGEDSRVSVSYKERDTSFERQAQEAMFAAGDIVHLFMQQQQNHHHKKEDRQRKLKRRKELELSRELQTKFSEEDEPQSRRRPPPPSRRRRPRDHDTSQKKKDVQKTLQYDNNNKSSSPRRTNKQQQDDGSNVVPENSKARKEPLNDDYMLQEEIWLNMLCNAVPSSVMNYFKVFGCVKVQKQTPKSSSRQSRPQGSPPHRQPFVTDEEYRKRQHRKQEEEQQQQQQQDRKRHFRNRMKEEEQEEAFPKQPTAGISLDEGEHGAHLHSGNTFDQDSSPVPEQQEDIDFLAALELEPPTGTMIDHTTSCNLSTILEECDSQLDGRSLDVIVNYPPNQPPTFAC